MSLEKTFGSLSKSVMGALSQGLPEKMKETLFIRTFGFLKVPMLFFISPSVVELTNQRCVVKVPLTRRTRNHLKSMYFGALAAGADCAGGLIAMRLIQDEGNRANLVFKDFKADFLKRAEGDVHFTCEQGNEIRDLVRKALSSGERENMTVYVVATVPSKLKDEPVAKFTLTLSLKKKS